MSSSISSILFVCTGNVCRSPFAEALLRKRLEEAGVEGVTVQSAGTMAMMGHPVAEEMLPEFERYGLSPDGLVGKQLDHELVAGADLIITMSKRQRAWIIDEWPEAGLRTVMLTSLRALDFGGADGGLTRDAVRSWARSGAQRSAADVPDPYGRTADVALRSASEITNFAQHFAAVPQVTRHGA